MLSHRYLLKNFDQNHTVYCCIVIKEKPTVGSPFFGAFLSDRIPKTTKDVTVNL